MAWFRNHYICERCNSIWTDEWSCMCDDECGHCGARHMTPYKSDDLTETIEEQAGEFVLVRSSDAAEYEPDYSPIMTFSKFFEAEEYLASRIARREAP